MKAKFIRILRFFGFDGPLRGLLEKLARGLIKKLIALRQFVINLLDSAQQFRNGD